MLGFILLLGSINCCYEIHVFMGWIKINWEYCSVSRVGTNQIHIDEEENISFLKYTPEEPCQASL